MTFIRSLVFSRKPFSLVTTNQTKPNLILTNPIFHLSDRQIAPPQPRTKNDKDKCNNDNYTVFASTPTNDNSLFH